MVNDRVSFPKLETIFCRQFICKIKRSPLKEIKTKAQTPYHAMFFYLFSMSGLIPLLLMPFDIELEFLKRNKEIQSTLSNLLKSFPTNFTNEHNMELYMTFFSISQLYRYRNYNL